MSFVTQEDVFNAVEPVLRGVFEEFADGKRVTQKFPRIPYAEAMRTTAPTSRTCATRSRCRRERASAGRASRSSRHLEKDRGRGLGDPGTGAAAAAPSATA
jgi:hypothetical protein